MMAGQFHVDTSEQILQYVKKISTKLDSMQAKINEQDSRIKYLENATLYSISDGKHDAFHMTNANTYIDENSINTIKEEFDQCCDSKELNRKAPHKSRVQKSSSFQDKSGLKPIRKPRPVHTIPSDKEERNRFNSFRRECLSKAIQWNFVDLISAYKDHQDVILPKWLSKDEIKAIQSVPDRKNQLKIFVCILWQKDFQSMQEWLKKCSFDVTVISKIWETFREFNDEEINKRKMKCFHCRMVDSVSVNNVADFLVSADIISATLYLKIVESLLPIGAQESLWRQVFSECSQYFYPNTMLITFQVALFELGKNNSDISRLSTEIIGDKSETLADTILKCHCFEQCSKSFHPVSCVKSMSLANVYFSPTTSRETTNDSSSMSASSSLSFNISTESHPDCTIYAQNDYENSVIHDTKPKSISNDSYDQSSMDSQQKKARADWNGITDRNSNSSMWNTDDGTTEADDVYPDVKGARQWSSDMHPREPTLRQRADENHPDMQSSRPRAHEMYPGVRGHRTRSSERKRQIHSTKNDQRAHNRSDDGRQQNPTFDHMPVKYQCSNKQYNFEQKPHVIHAKNVHIGTRIVTTTTTRPTPQHLTLSSSDCSED